VWKVIQSFDEATPDNPRTHSRAVQGKIRLQERYFTRGKISSSESPEDHAGHEVVGKAQKSCKS